MMSIQRRDLLKGAASLPLAAILADPLIARAVADQLETVTIETPSGRSVIGALALPAARKAPAVLLVHEWWGLNDQIKAVAADFAKQGYVALALDLYGGNVAAMNNPGAAQRYMQAMMADPKAGFETCAAWVDWLGKHDRSTGKIGTVGWCFGGGWALNAAIVRPVDATVIYYGNVVRTVAQLRKLKGSVMGHFATRDGWINKPMVNGFVANMKKAGKADQLTVYWYNADHAFANPSGGRFNEAAAQRAWQRTTAFFKKNLA
jgi:carboxymethylenebutenolidase